VGPSQPVWRSVDDGKGKIDKGIVEFHISTKKYKSVTAFERTDKYYFIITTPKSSSISDSAITKLESSKT